MKRSSAFFVGLIVVAVVVYKVVPWGDVQQGFSRLREILPSASSTAALLVTPNATSSAVTFNQDRTKPYTVQLRSGEGKNALTWFLTVADPVGGYVYDGTNTYEAYGQVLTSTDQLVLSAYRPNGDVLANATGTWSGQVFSGVAERAGAVSSLDLLPPIVSTTRLTFVRVQDRWEQKKPDMGCEFDLTMPVVQAGGGVSGAAADRMNQAIRANFLVPAAQYLDLDDGKKSVAQTADQAKNVFMQSCRAQLAEDRRLWDGSSDVGGMLQRSLDVSVRVTYNQDGWLSFVSDMYGYTGGAHGNTLRRTFIFNTRTGERQELSDLIRPEAEALFMQRVGRSLLAQYGDGLFDDSSTPIRAFVDASPARARTLYAEGLSGFSTTTNLYLVGRSANVVFQQYELTPYAVGIPEISLPYAQWDDLTVAGNDPFVTR